MSTSPRYSDAAAMIERLGELIEHMETRIEQRAQELIRPAVIAAEDAAAVRIAGTEAENRRLDSKIDELQRVLRSAFRARDHAIAEHHKMGHELERIRSTARKYGELREAAAIEVECGSIAESEAIRRRAEAMIASWATALHAAHRGVDCTCAPAPCGGALVTSTGTCHQHSADNAGEMHLADKCPALDLRPRVITWDYRQQPDMDQLAAAIRDLSGGSCDLIQVDTDSDEHAVVVSAEPLTPTQALAAFEAHND